jgi:hypothetical protein
MGLTEPEIDSGRMGSLKSGVGMIEDEKSATLKDLIDPEHLLQAIANSLEHGKETAHGTTGLHFENYTILVHKRKGFCWYIELKFKRGERETRSCLTHSS